MPLHSYSTSRNLSLGNHHGSVRRLELEMLQKPIAGNNKSWHLISTYHVPDSGLCILCTWMNSLNLPTTLESAYYCLDFTSEGTGRGTEEHVMEPGFDGVCSTLAWKTPWMEEPGGLQSMGSGRVRHNWATSLSLFTFMPWWRKWQPTPAFLPGESQGWWSLMGCLLWGLRVGHDWSDLAAAAWLRSPYTSHPG